MLLLLIPLLLCLESALALEMAGAHQKFISEVLYIYNMKNPLSDFRVALKNQREMVLYIRQKKPYAPLKSLF